MNTTLRVNVNDPVEDHGTIVIFHGTDDTTGRVRRFAVDHRPAQWLIDHLTDVGETDVEVESWQLIGA